MPALPSSIKPPHKVAILQSVPFFVLKGLHVSSTDTDGPAPGFFKIFTFFFGISSVTIGGGYVMVPVIQRALEKRGWVPESEFYDIFARAQSIPGPLALNTALFVGQRIAGLPGFIAAFLGILLPPFAAMIALAKVLEHAGSWPAVQGFLDGAFAVVPGLTAALAFNMVRKRTWSIPRALLTLAGAAALVASGRWAVPVFFTVVALSWLYERFKA
jgi:chromate transporter